MPHQVHLRTLGRTADHRLSMLRNLAVSVLRYERVKTTEAKAKEVRRLVDRAIGFGRSGSLIARRRALALLRDRLIVEKLFDDLAKRYADRASGFTRLVRLGHRVGDGAPMMMVELVEGEAKAERAEGSAPAARRISPAAPEAEKEAAGPGGALPPGRSSVEKEAAGPGKALPPARPAVEKAAEPSEPKGPVARARELARRATGRGAAKKEDAPSGEATGKEARPKAARKPRATASETTTRGKKRAPSGEGVAKPKSPRGKKKE